MRTRLDILLWILLVMNTSELTAQPVINLQPVDQLNATGTAATFSITATGTPSPTIQWRFYSSTATYTNIPAATQEQLIIPNVQPTSGLFAAVVSNSAGSVTSRQARLVVLAPPKLTQQPASRSVEVGANLSFTLTAVGDAPLSYVWYRNNAPIAGQTRRTLAFTNVQPSQAGDYFAVVGNPVGVVTSQVATLTVHEPVSLCAVTQRWRYDQSGTDLGTIWKETDFIDTAWPEGEGAFYNERITLPVPKTTLLSLTNVNGSPIRTYYFRTQVRFDGNPEGMVLVASAYLDDGAIFYLNGSELGRVRMSSGPIAATTTAAEAPEGKTMEMIFPASALVQGDNVLAVEVHQHGFEAADVAFSLALKATKVIPPLPDLLIWGPGMFPRFEDRFFATNSCEVLEGTVLPGMRRLLRFTTESRNAGTADLVMSDPSGNPEFEFHACHNHHHFLGYVDYRLLKQVGSNWVQVTRGHKPSFALLDSDRWDTNAAATARFDDHTQGIQKGWSDIYSYNVPGNYVDVTDVPPGRYLLEIEVDPDHRIPELNEWNNVTALTVEVPTLLPVCTGISPGDNFADALPLYYAVSSRSANTECSTREPGEPKLVSEDRPGGPSVWFRWTAPYTGRVSIDTEGSSFDTVLGLYSGTKVDNLTLVSSDDDSGMGLTSRLVTNVLAGVEYSIQVEGFHLFISGIPGTGELLLNINANANDSLLAAQPLSSKSGTTSGTTVRATKEPGEPEHGSHPGGRSIWYVWTAPLTTEFAFDTEGSRFDTLLAIYTGSTIENLTQIVSNDGAASNGASGVTFNAVAGTTYRIAVDGRAGTSGFCTLRWRPAMRLRAHPVVDGSFHFSLAELPYEPSLIESSSDLVQWTSWLRITNTSVALPMNAPISLPHQYFRVRAE
jgi:hypothetical protein